MNAKLNRRDLGSICTGCLSVDRKLAPISDEEHKNFFGEILDPLEPISSNCLICWECMARVRSVVTFKQQIRLAQHMLVKFMHHQSDLKTLSKLTQHTPPSPLIQYEQIVANNDIQSNISTCSIQMSHNLIGNSELDTNVPVKSEQDSCLDGDMYDADNFDGNDDVNAVKKSKVNPKKSKKTKRKSGKELFNDSDDEPLCLKQSGTTDMVVDGGEGEGKKAGRRGRRRRPPGVVSTPLVRAKLAALGAPPGAVTMLQLSWNEVEAERSTIRESVRWRAATLRCESCLLVFNHSDKLKAHNEKHELSAGPLVCSVCLVRSGGERAMQAHLRRHLVRWRCEWCGGRWSRAGVAADHVSRAHNTPPAIHRCGVCQHTVTSLAALRAHSKIHNERAPCAHCARTFRDRASLRTHMLIHTGVKEWQCPYPGCGKQFLFKKAMELHATTHEGHQHLYCHQCDVSFKNRMSLYQHMKYNLKHVDPKLLKHECAECGKRFLRLSRLEEHRAAAHTRTAPLACAQPDCDFRCASRGVLRAHRRVTHGGGMKPARNHVCHHCGKTYTSKKSLEGHLRSHTGEKPPRRSPVALPTAAGDRREGDGKKTEGRLEVEKTGSEKLLATETKTESSRIDLRK